MQLSGYVSSAGPDSLCCRLLGCCGQQLYVGCMSAASADRVYLPLHVGGVSAQQQGAHCAAPSVCLPASSLVRKGFSTQCPVVQHCVIDDWMPSGCRGLRGGGRARGCRVCGRGCPARGRFILHAVWCWACLCALPGSPKLPLWSNKLVCLWCHALLACQHTQCRWLLTGLLLLHGSAGLLCTCNRLLVSLSWLLQCCSGDSYWDGSETGEWEVLPFCALCTAGCRRC